MLVYDKIGEAVGVRPVSGEVGLAGVGAGIGTEVGYVLGRGVSGHSGVGRIGGLGTLQMLASSEGALGSRDFLCVYMSTRQPLYS